MRYTSTPEPENWQEIQDEAYHSANGVGFMARFLGVLILAGVGVIVGLNAGAMWGIATALGIAAVLVWVIDPVQEKGDRR